ncbi:unnamed protein product [Rotaria magnacalcarata]
MQQHNIYGPSIFILYSWEKKKHIPEVFFTVFVKIYIHLATISIHYSIALVSDGSNSKVDFYIVARHFNGSVQ